MSIEHVQAGLKLISENEGEADFVGERSAELVHAAESALGVVFPPSYRMFVSQLGAGSIASEEFFGVITDDFEKSSIPNAVWLTLRQRQTSSLPDDLILVYGVGNGQYFALDTSDRDPNGEAPVVAWTPGARVGEQFEVVAPDFGTFFLETVNRALGDS